MSQTLSLPLSKLLDGLAEPSQDCVVHGVCCRSEDIHSGDSFAACRGLSRHGLLGVAQAAERGAAAVIYDPQDAPSVALPIPHAAVPELSRLLSELAGRFYRHPSKQLPVIGITGTDGKTSTAHLLAQLMSRLQRVCGVIGTLGAGTIEALHSTGHTTPDAVRVQRELFDMLQRGHAAAVLEVSSHALDQHRCDAVRFDTAVFTTLGQDHLDYHGSVENYAAAKRRLFTDLAPRRCVINVDDVFGQELDACVAKYTEVRRCSLHAAHAQSQAQGIELHAGGLRFDWSIDGQTCTVEAPNLYGRFNVMNLLLSATAVQVQGIDATQIAEAIAQLKAVPGRLEALPRVADAPRVFLDYAHTEQALCAALEALRAHFDAPVHCVFGCGGDRDRVKRPRMGAVAERLAHRVMLTDDNPRTEDPKQIVREIRTGLREPERVRVIQDRAEAIREAVRTAPADAVVLIAGKGHEQEQITAAGAQPFSDWTAAQQALEACA